MKIRVVITVLSILLAALPVQSYAQNVLTGNWSGKEGAGKEALAVSMQLKVSGQILSGTRTVTFGERKQECPIENGKVEGRLFSFDCELTGPQGDHPFTASFEGFINRKGDEITVSIQKPATGGPVTLMRTPPSQ